MSAASKIPENIASLILGHVAADTLVNYKARQDIASCALVSRKFRAVSLRHQWETTTVSLKYDDEIIPDGYNPDRANDGERIGGRNPKTLDMVVEFFNAPTLSRHVRTLSLKYHVTEGNNYTLTGRDLWKVLQLFPKLRNLHWTNILLTLPTDPLVAWRGLVPPDYKLDQMSFQFVYHMYRRTINIPKDRVEDVLSVFVFFPSIREVVVGNCEYELAGPGQPQDEDGAPAPLPGIRCQIQSLYLRGEETRVQENMDRLMAATGFGGLHTLEVGWLSPEGTWTLAKFMTRRGAGLKHLMIYLNTEDYANSEYLDIDNEPCPGDLLSCCPSLWDLRICSDYSIEDIDDEESQWHIIFFLLSLLSPTRNAELRRIRIELRRLNKSGSWVPADLQKTELDEEHLLRLPKLQTLSFAPLLEPGQSFPDEDIGVLQRLFPRLHAQDRLEFCQGDDMEGSTWMKSKLIS